MIMKFCGMRDQEAIDEAEKLGARMCGFIFHPGSPRFISPTGAAELHSGDLERVGVFVEDDPAVIRAAAAIANLRWIQLHGHQDDACAKAVGPHRVIRVLWPERHKDLESLKKEAEKHAPYCAMFLLDSGSAGGGSGACLDWQKLDGLKLPRPWLAAGGINPENVEFVFVHAEPDGLDVNSGVEDAPGRKNHAKMRALVETLQKMGRAPEKPVNK